MCILQKHLKFDAARASCTPFPFPFILFISPSASCHLKPSSHIFYSCAYMMEKTLHNTHLQHTHRYSKVLSFTLVRSNLPEKSGMNTLVCSANKSLLKMPFHVLVKLHSHTHRYVRVCCCRDGISSVRGQFTADSLNQCSFNSCRLYRLHCRIF